MKLGTIIEHDFRVKVSDMSDIELHLEIAGQWNATRDFDEDQMNIMMKELVRRAKAQEALDKMVAENQRLGLYDDNPEVPCKTHPDAPHGFNRNASFDEDRYVCDCEFWEPPEETFILDRGCYERGCVAYDERDGDGVYMSGKRVHKSDKSIHEWVGLTDEERFGEHTTHLTRNEWALLIEAKLKEKNT